MPSVHDMPLDELRARTNDVRDLLHEARAHVESAAFAPASLLEASVSRLADTLVRVQELLPGVTRLSPESMRRLDAEESALARREPHEAAPQRLDRLSDSEVTRAQEILAELKDGMERMDLLQDVAEGIEDLVAMIEAGRAELGRRAAATR